MALLTDEELLETLEKQLPALLARHPEMEQRDLDNAFPTGYYWHDKQSSRLSKSSSPCIGRWSH